MLKIYLILLLTIYMPDGEERIRMVIQEAPSFDLCVELGDSIKERLEPVVDNITREGIVNVTINASCKYMELEVNGVTM